MYLGASTTQRSHYPCRLQTMDSGFSLLLQAAVAMHEMYLQFRAAGFTKDEALTLVAKMTKDG